MHQHLIFLGAKIDLNSMDNILVANPRISERTVHQPMP